MKCEHGRVLCSECYYVDDTAKRAYNAVNLHVFCTTLEERRNSWVALKLADGSSDGVLYDTRRDAIRHQSDERLCAYFSFRNAPEGFASAKDAGIFLGYHRLAYSAGARLPDPDDCEGGKEMVMPMGLEHIRDQVTKFKTPM